MNIPLECSKCLAEVFGQLVFLFTSVDAPRMKSVNDGLDALDIVHHALPLVLVLIEILKCVTDHQSNIGGGTNWSGENDAHLSSA